MPNHIFTRNTEMTNALNLYLANLAVWNVKLHNLHWNVVGPMFKPVHEYTESLYDEAFEAFDAVAEVLKMRGEMPLCSMKDYLAVATVKEVEARAYSCCEVVGMVREDMELMLNLAKEIRKAAADADDFQVQAMFEDFMEGFVKQLWFIDAMQQGATCSK